MIDDKMLSGAEKEQSISWILDNGLTQKSAGGELLTMIRALGLKPFFGLTESLALGFILAICTGISISIYTYENADFVLLFSFLAAPVFYGSVQLYSYFKECTCGMHELIKMTKYGSGKLLTLRMAYLSAISIPLCMLQQMLLSISSNTTYSLQPRTICFLVCGLFIYCSSELLVRLVAHRPISRLIVPSVWLVLGIVAVSFSKPAAALINGIPTFVVALISLAAFAMYILELRIQLKSHKEELTYAFN